MRIIAIIFGVVAALALAGFVTKVAHHRPAACETEDCSTSNCPKRASSPKLLAARMRFLGPAPISANARRGYIVAYGWLLTMRIPWSRQHLHRKGKKKARLGICQGGLLFGGISASWPMCPPCLRSMVALSPAGKMMPAPTRQNWLRAESRGFRDEV